MLELVCYQAVDAAEYDEIIVCYCKFEPVSNPVLQPMPQAKVIEESFDTHEAYKEWEELHSAPRV